METTIEIIDISLDTIQIGIEAIMYEHFQEVSPANNPEKIEVNWEYYIFLQKQEKLISYGCFNSGILVGYLLLVLINPPHYKNDTVAILDTIFILKDFRLNRIGLKLITVGEQEAKKRGATIIHLSAKEGSNLDRVLRLRKYNVRDIVFSKEL